MTNIDICQEVKQNFIDSSYDTNNNRAFPDIRDGLKPGQRACLWEMYNKKYVSSKPHVKSAKISGGVIANWWPHSDVAIYETFARMSMPYINNIPEVDFHGSNGNQILGNDAIANQRYTEARLSPVVEEGMLSGINKNIVPMISNFSEDAEWPSVLPAFFPRLLVNGCQGIGVSIANNWTLHNFTETAQIIIDYIETNIVNNEYYPDFPTGGTIINKDELSKINETGKGKIILEANYKINGQEINFYEFPYQVYIEPVIEKIKEVVEDGTLTGIKNVINKSDKKQLSLVVECAIGTNPEKIIAQLFALTPLRSQYNVNQVGMVGKTPRLRNLKEVLDIYINHNLSCIKNEYQYDYEKAAARVNIIEGLLKAITNIDDVINIIRTDNNPKSTLISTFGLNEEQVQAILDMKLGRLSKLEKQKLDDELQEKKDLIELCLSIINNEDKQRETLIKRLRDLVEKYGDERRTKITQKTIVKVNGKAKEVKEIIPEDVVVTLNGDGYIKNIPINNFKVSKRGSVGSSMSDKIIDTIKTNTTDMLILFSDAGKAYRIFVNSITQCGMNDKGTAPGSILQLASNEHICRIVATKQNNKYNYLFFTTKNGLVKKTAISEFIGDTQNLRGLKAINIKDGDELCSIKYVNNEDIILFTHNGQSIRFDSSLMTPTGKTASGIKGITLSDNDYITSSIIVDKDITNIFITSEDGYGKKVPIISFNPQGRGGKGSKCGNGVVGADTITDDDMILIFTDNKNFTISAKSIPEVSKSALGNKIIKSGKIINICKL